MSWTPIKPPNMSSNITQRQAVLLSGTTIVAGRTPRLCLTIRPHLLEGCDWLQPGAMYEVLSGGGEHAGMMRVAKTLQGGFVARRIALAKERTVSFLVPWPNGAVPSKQKPQPIEFDYGDGWLEVTLPEWARRAEPGTAEPRRTQPFVGIADRVADPAAANRVARKG